MAQIEALKWFRSKNYNPSLLTEDDWIIYSRMIVFFTREKRIKIWEEFWYKINPILV